MTTQKYDALRALGRQDYGMTIEKGISIIEALAPFFAPDPNAPDPASLIAGDADLAERLMAGRKIDAIKRARSILGDAGLPADLATAKRLVEDLCKKSYPNLVSVQF